MQEKASIIALEQQWKSLVESMLAAEADVAPGKMMSADALTYRGKVFVFFSTKGGRPGLGGRFGRDGDPEDFDFRDWQHLAPFKTRPPMKDWIVLGESDLDHWRDFAAICLDKARHRKDSGA